MNGQEKISLISSKGVLATRNNVAARQVLPAWSPDLFIPGFGQVLPTTRFELFDEVMKQARRRPSNLAGPCGVSAKPARRGRGRTAQGPSARLAIRRDAIGGSRRRCWRISTRLWTMPALVETARTKSQRHLLAISDAAFLNEAVTDVSGRARGPIRFRGLCRGQPAAPGSRPGRHLRPRQAGAASCRSSRCASGRAPRHPAPRPC